MPSIYNLILPAKTSLITLINRNYNTNIQENNYSFSLPNITNIFDSTLYEKNTFITLTPYASTGFIDELKVFYNRINIAEIGIIIIPKDTYNNVHSALQYINNFYGLNLTPEEIDNNIIIDNYTNTILSINLTSIMFYGNTIISTKETVLNQLVLTAFNSIVQP